MRKSVLSVLFLSMLQTAGCGIFDEDMLQPQEGTFELKFSVTRPVTRTLVHQPTTFIEGCASGPVVNDVVYSLNGGTERSTIAGDEECEFHANVPNLIPGLNELIVTVRGEEVTYDSGEETARWDAEYSDTLIVYYSDQQTNVLMQVDPDTIRILQTRGAHLPIEVTVSFYAVRSLFPSGGETPDQIVTSALPVGIAREPQSPNCQDRRCTFDLRTAGTPAVGIHQIPVEVQLGSETAVDTLYLVVSPQSNCYAFEITPQPLDYVNRGASYNRSLDIDWTYSSSDDLWLAMEGNGVLDNVTFEPNPVPDRARWASVNFDVNASAPLGSAEFSLRGARPNFEEPLSTCVVPYTTTIAPADTLPPEIAISLVEEGTEAARDSIFIRGIYIDRNDGNIPPSGVDSIVYSVNGGVEAVLRGWGASEEVDASGTISGPWSFRMLGQNQSADTVLVRAWDRGGNLDETTYILDHGGSSGACSAFNLRLDADTAYVAVDGASELLVYVDRSAGFTEQVELSLVGAGLPPSEVFTTYSFNPNPVLPGVTTSTLSFALYSGMSPGNRFTFTIQAASPLLEDPSEECSIPVTFEVVTP